VVLTWKSGDVLRYRLGQNNTNVSKQSDPHAQAHTLELTATQQIESEGWGLTSNGTSLISSDGSATLTFRNLDTLTPQKKIIVRVMDRPVKHLNELEWANGCIMANIWGSDTVVVIDPTDGQVRYTLDLALLAKRERNHQANVANGIAYRDDNGNLLVTGKNWQHIYELELSNATQ
jgi:glutamine cyclotransferase